MVIAIGPGSLCTSILPALLVPGMPEAIAASGALVVFACNVATQPGETRGYDLADHLDALARHGLGHLPHVVLANNRFDAHTPEGWLGEPVRLRWPPATLAAGGPRLVLDDVVDPDNAHHHEPLRLAGAIVGIWAREGGRRRRPASTGPRGRLTEGGWPRATGTWSPRCAPSSRRSTRRAPATARRRSRPRTPGARPRTRGRPADRAAGRPRGPRPRRAADVHAPARDARLDDRRRSLSDGVAAWPLPSPWVAEPGWWPGPTSSSSSLPDEAPEFSPPGSDEVGLPGLVAISAGTRWSSLGKSGEAVGDVPEGGSGAAGALLELEARQGLSRALRGELNRVLNAESANLQRAVAPGAGRRFPEDAIGGARCRAGGLTEQPYLVRLVADARRETPEATPHGAGRAPRRPPLCGPARPRADRERLGREGGRRPAPLPPRWSLSA